MFFNLMGWKFTTEDNLLDDLETVVAFKRTQQLVYQMTPSVIERWPRYKYDSQPPIYWESCLGEKFLWPSPRGSPKTVREFFLTTYNLAGFLRPEPEHAEEDISAFCKLARTTYFDILGNEEHCWKAIKEILAVKMTDQDRMLLLGNDINSDCETALHYNSLYQIRDRKSLLSSVYYNLDPEIYDYQEPDWDKVKETARDEFESRLRDQRWYEVTEAGQLEVVDGLFQVITANPTAFLHMLVQFD